MNRRPVMHPPLAEHARSLQIIVGGLVLAWSVVGGTGCSEAPVGSDPSPFGAVDTIASTTVPRDSALSVLTAMERAAFDSAFVQLDEFAMTRYVRTEQLDTTGTATALHTHTLRYPSGTEAGTIRRRDTVGQFQSGGILSSITPPQDPTERPANLAAQALPDQPAYLAPRTREAYRYALRSDSLLDGTPTFVVEAKARTDDRGRDQGIRYARLIIDRTSNELVGLSVVRANQILLFRENSQLTIRLRTASDGTWVPHLTRVRAVVSVPLRSSRQFRTVSAFYDYTR